MIIAGPCLYTHLSEEADINTTAIDLKDEIGNDDTIFRCKLWGGGTTVEKWVDGVGSNGLATLQFINENIMEAATEVRTPEEILHVKASGLKVVWVGARNSANYSLYKTFELVKFDKVFVKRHPAMTIDEFVGLYDNLTQRFKMNVYPIERGIVGFSNNMESKFSPDLKGVIRIKHERPDIFDRLVIDCSHSVFVKDYVADVYKSFKSIGVDHFMFECMSNPDKAKTDKNHMLSVSELMNIIKDVKNG